MKYKDMNVGLFIPCYINQFYPEVGIATLSLLEKLGCKVDYPLGQTCCGQPIANSGLEEEAKDIYRLFCKNFDSYDYIVAPSGSCIYHVKHNYTNIQQTNQVKNVREKAIDLVDFLVDILQVKSLDSSFAYNVGLNQSCHALRGLRQGKSSEIVGEDFSKLKYLLSLVKNLELLELDRPDECCGFGGTFSVKEEVISVRMGQDRIQDHKKQGVQFITSGDMSCLMHLEGIIRREKTDLKVIHIAQILNHV